MKSISRATKESIIKKALSTPDVTLRIIAEQNNVGYSSLTKWMRQFHGSNRSGQTRRLRNRETPLSRVERLQHVFATASLDEQTIGVYCRERGLYALQLTEWKKELMAENDEEKNKTLLNEIQALRAENKELKQNINRKDRALAETAVLLVMKKKADAIWADHEDD